MFSYGANSVKIKSKFSMPPFSPMMAPLLRSFRDIVYPVYVCPRVKGERCVIRNGAPLTKRLTPIPNHQISSELSGLPDFDGMLQVMYSDSDEMYGSHSVMEPNAKLSYAFIVFDLVDTELTYAQRLDKTSDLLDKNRTPSITMLRPETINDKLGLQRYGDAMLDIGHVWSIISDPDATYHYGLCPYNSGARYLWDMEKL